MSVEMLGYLASSFVGLSLLMADIKKLRYINLIGCLIFVYYGLNIQAYPVAVMNLFCALVNIYHIYLILKQEKYLQ
ncbi:uroporphyrinogen decarboxylase [Shewanella colwelliana]|nr:uroporphyrinogen decarboxylase [Shewanella colwelliana]MCZ4338478.1 uroporphyrinogen decarboxylase [Shewanella colwelliana]